MVGWLVGMRNEVFIRSSEFLLNRDAPTEFHPKERKIVGMNGKQKLVDSSTRDDMRKPSVWIDRNNRPQVAF